MSRHSNLIQLDHICHNARKQPDLLPIFGRIACCSNLSKHDNVRSWFYPPENTWNKVSHMDKQFDELMFFLYLYRYHM